MISHSCVVGVNQQIYVELAKYRDVELRIIVPRVWREAVTGRKMYFEQDSPMRDSAVLADVIFAGGCSKHFYRNSFLKPFTKFTPDIVFLDEEPQCLATFQFVLFAKLFGAKVGFRTHENITRRFPFPFSSIAAFTLNETDYAVAVSKGAAVTLAKKGPIGDIPVISHGLDLSRFRKIGAEKLRHALTLKDFVIGYTGTLTPQKGILTLIEAMGKLKYVNLPIDFQVFILGSGYLKGEIQLLAQKLGIEDKLVMHNSVPHMDVPRYLNCMDVLVLPSITTPTWKEQFGRVLIEAMACEIPVVGSDSGQIPYVIEEARGGLVFHEGDAEDLKNKLTTLIVDKKLYRELGTTGRKNVTREYACSKVAEQLYHVFRKVLNGHVDQKPRNRE